MGGGLRVRENSLLFFFFETFPYTTQIGSKVQSYYIDNIVLISRIPPSEADIQAALASLAQKKGTAEAEAAPAEAAEA